MINALFTLHISQEDRLRREGREGAGEGMPGQPRDGHKRDPEPPQQGPCVRPPPPHPLNGVPEEEVSLIHYIHFSLSIKFNIRLSFMVSMNVIHSKRQG